MRFDGVIRLATSRAAVEAAQRHLPDAPYLAVQDAVEAAIRIGLTATQPDSTTRLSEGTGEEEAIWIGFADGIPYISKSPTVLGEAGPVAVRYVPAGPVDGWPAVTLVRGSKGDRPVALDPTVGAFEGEETRRYVPA